MRWRFIARHGSRKRPRRAHASHAPIWRRPGAPQVRGRRPDAQGGQRCGCTAACLAFAAPTCHSRPQPQLRGIGRRTAAAPCGPRCCWRSLPARRAPSATCLTRRACFAPRAQQVQPACSAPAAQNDTPTLEVLCSRWRHVRAGTTRRSCHVRYARADVPLCRAGGEGCKVHKAAAKPCREYLVRQDEDPGLWCQTSRRTWTTCAHGGQLRSRQSWIERARPTQAQVAAQNASASRRRFIN